MTLCSPNTISNIFGLTLALRNMMSKFALIAKPELNLTIRWVSNNRETLRQTTDLISELTKESIPNDEPVNRFVINESKVRPSLQPEAPARTNRLQISSHLLPGERSLHATQIRKMVVKKST